MTVLVVPAPTPTASHLADDLRELPVAHDVDEEPAGDVVTDEAITWLTAAVPTAAAHSRGHHHD